MPPVQSSQFAASFNPPDPELKLQRNLNLNYSAAMLCADLASYIGVEPIGSGKDVVFILTDPGENGEERLSQFNAGIFPRVNPKLFMEARSFLQKEVARSRSKMAVTRD